MFRKSNDLSSSRMRGSRIFKIPDFRFCGNDRINTKAIIFFALIFLFAQTARAELVINEIMYDPEGADSGREWIEVKNSGTDPADLSEYKFLEDNSHHALNVFQGNSILNSGEFAIIADDPQKFLADFSSFSGTIFDSSWSSFSNSEETLALTKDDNVIDQVSYSSAMGASGDGNSLQKTESGWIAATATPGAENENLASSASGQNQNLNASDSQSSSSRSSSEVRENSQIQTETKPKSIRVKIIPPGKNLISGLDYLFKADVAGVSAKDSGNVKWLWNFGNGEVSDKEAPVHSYSFVGDYVVYVEASLGDLNASDQVKIKIISPELSVSNTAPGSGGFVEIKNNSSSDLDLSRWSIVSGGKFFYIPKGTTIISKGKITFSSKITSLDSTEEVKLLTPGGQVYSSFGKKPVQANLSKSAVNYSVKKAEGVKAVPEISSLDKSRDEISGPNTQSETKQNTAAVNNADFSEEKQTSSSIYLWLGFIVILAILSGAAYFLLRRKKTEEIEILE